MHRAVILLGLLLAAFGALLGALGNQPVAAASIAIAGALVVVAGLWLRRGSRADEPAPVQHVEPDVQPVVAANQPSEALGLWPDDASPAIATVPASAEAPSPVLEEPSPVLEEPSEPVASREAELAREAELNAIADELRALRSRDLSSIHIPEWKARIETWVDVDLKARAERGEEVPPQAAEWMRDFGEIPVKDWRRHLLRHLRRLGYRNYREGEW